MDDFRQPWHGLTEVNYDAGRTKETYTSLLISHGGPNAAHLPHFLAVDGLINGALIGLLVMQYVFRVEKHFRAAQHFHTMAHSEPFVPGALEQLKEELELTVYSMRKALDHFVQGAVLTFESQIIKATGKLPVDSVGKLIEHRDNGRGLHQELVQTFFGSPNEPEDPSDFLRTLNTISNSYKHGFFLPEAQQYGSPVAPNIVLFDKTGNDLRKPPVVHNHDACHLVMGFQDTINRLLPKFNSNPMF